LAHSRALKEALSPLRNVVLPMEAQQVEHVLRVARVALAAAYLVIVRLVVGPSSVGARTALLAGAAYLAYSVVLLLGVRKRISGWWALLLHSVDVLWAASLPVLTGNPYLPFSVFFLFTLLSAAYRWGFWKTLATVGSTIGLLLLAAGLPSLTGTAVGGWSASDKLPARAIGWVLMGSLVGFLGEGQRALRERVLVASRLLAHAEMEREPRRTLKDLLLEMLDLFQARGVTVVLEDGLPGRARIWHASRVPRGREVRFESTELNGLERERYLFPAPGHAWYAVQSRRGRGDAAELVVLDEGGQCQETTRARDSGAHFPDLAGCRSYYAAGVR